MLREETKRRFRISRMHDLHALHSVCSCIGDFLFGLRMAILDLYYGMRGVVRGHLFLTVPYIRDLLKELYYGIKDRDMRRFRLFCLNFRLGICLSYTWSRNHYAPDQDRDLDTSQEMW